MKQKRPLKNNKKIKKSDKIFFLIFRNCPQRCQGGRRLHLQRPQSVFEENEAEEAAESSSSNSIDCGSQPIYEYRNRTTTLIPFLRFI